MDKYVYTIIEQGTPYPHNLERLAEVYKSLHEHKNDKETVIADLVLSEQIYFRMCRQLKERRILVDGKVIEPKAPDAFKFAVPIPVLQGNLSITPWTILLKNLANRDDLDDILNRFKEKYANDTEFITKVSDDFSTAIAVFGLLSRKLEPFKECVSTEYQYSETQINELLDKGTLHMNK